ncbi:universal stress protein [Rhodanobacter umsongensis]|uniref:Universal stress protein n=1 Tax=Rhodanobacter umsongensis TaxID=633153 RepID=A0ABW0JPE7_9GAMM
MEYAIRLAAAFGASVTGVCVCPSPDVTMSVYDAPDLVLESIEEARQLMGDASAAEASFLALARELGVTDAFWQVADGDVPHSMKLIGNWHDLLVLGRTSSLAWGSSSAIGDIVLGCGGAPCLIVPPEMHDKPPVLNRIAIAWNGSAEALRAVHAALPMLIRAKVVILNRGGNRASPMDQWLPGFELTGYLQRHGVIAETHVLSDRGEAIGGDLLHAAGDVQADLLVMGGYGHARLREWILGGATREVLEKAMIPVLMRH